MSEELETKHGTILPNVSTCKSPQCMLGAVVKNYFAQKIGKKPDEVSFVSLMPCVRKLGESERAANQTVSVGHDIDHVLTTVELAALLKKRGVDLAAMEDGSYDKILGDSSGAAQLFGTTGGVMEAAIRTVYEVVTGSPMEHLVVTAVRGLDGVKEATVTMTPVPGGVLSDGNGEQKPIEVRVAVANGLGNAKKLVQDVEDGVSPYHFIEVMACPGGESSYWAPI
jgi:iron only hydrogenase large subunit-like protein